MYADLIIDISHEALNKTFQYEIPKELEPAVSVGSVVNVPFGKGDKLKKAFVVGISGEAKIDVAKIKLICDVNEKDVDIEDRLISLAFWMANNYGATVSSCLHSVLPVSKKAVLPDKKTVELNVLPNVAREYLDKLKSKKNYSVSKERLILELLEEGSLPWEIIISKLNISSSVIRDLEKREIVKVNSTKTHFTFSNKLNIRDKKVELNPDQKQALDTFVSDWENGERNTYLLYGITGSGKTEVYIRMLEKVIEDGKDAIVLIPEIALTYQTLMRFYHRFGDMVSVTNSRLSPAERYDIFERAKKGEIRIIIGPRSALFTPLKNLGLVIIDEEHETSYKSEKMPRYHAREVAKRLTDLASAGLVLGSATPSIESFYAAQKGEYKLLRLKNRAGGAKIAAPEIVDLRAELKSGNRSIISKRLNELINNALNEGKQTMLFINRRGMLASISCRACGEVIKCPHCDVSLSLHRDKRLYCHYCGYVTPSPDVCPTCGSKYIGGLKAGTEKIEMEVQKLFPRARVLRMDADSTKGKDGHEKILSIFANKGADILIGTQMIVKGHDFSDVTTVGILAADLSLNANDFRSAERTFDLLTQACGRAGRGDSAGHVVIQTYRPDHYAVALSAAQDYEAFYKKEIAYRSLLSYPPVGHILLVMLLSKNEDELIRCAKAAVNSINDKKTWNSGVVTPGISKIQDVYRRMIYIKSSELDELFLIRDIINSKTADFKQVTVYYDTDPQNM